MTADERRERHRLEAVRYRAKYPERVAAANKRWREAHKEEQKEYIAEWRAAHPGYGLAAGRKHRSERRELVRAANKRYREAHPDKELQKSRRYESLNRDRKNALRRERYHADIEKARAKNASVVAQFRKENPLHGTMNLCVRRMLLRSDLPKTDRSRQYIGCSPGFLRNHIEAQFEPGMSWANYGEWHVDHIVPLSWWPIKEHPELLFEASHYSNLRPRWRKFNESKGARFAA